MDEAEFIEILSLGHELAGIELKGPGARTDRHFVAKVIRSCLGMANRRGGGKLIIGVNQTAHDPPIAVGLSKSDAITWNYDEFSDSLADYADPSVSFELTEFVSDGKTFVEISVHEFDDIPILCKKDYSGVLRKGACYVRPRRKPETTEIPAHEDMRDLLDLAAEKRLKKLVTQTHTAGLLPSASQQASDDERFADQAGDLLR